MQKSRANHAFTLLELAIVILVIALIVGGITVGRNMVENAKAVNVITEQEKYTAAIKQFQDKYRALPGDMINATSYWTSLGAGCPRTDSAAATATTCNGTGDGKIANSKDYTNVTATGDMYEAHRAWQHLALAGMIPGSYTGGMETSGTIAITPGTRAPATNYIDNASWNLYYVGPKNANSDFFNGDYTHILYMGTAAYNGTAANKAVFPVKQMYNIDLKVDDGVPSSGKVRSGKAAGIFGGSCITTTNDASGVYNTSTVSNLCVPIFITGIK